MEEYLIEKVCILEPFKKAKKIISKEFSLVYQDVFMTYAYIIYDDMAVSFELFVVGDDVVKSLSAEKDKRHAYKMVLRQIIVTEDEYSYSACLLVKIEAYIGICDEEFNKKITYHARVEKTIDGVKLVCPDFDNSYITCATLHEACEGMGKALEEQIEIRSAMRCAIPEPSNPIDWDNSNNDGSELIAIVVSVPKYKDIRLDVFLMELLRRN